MSVDKSPSWLRRLWAGRNPVANPSVLVLLLTVVIAIGAAFAVATLNHQADDRRQNQLVLAELEQIAERLIDVLEHEKAEGALVEREAKASLAALLAKLAKLDSGGDAAANVSDAGQSFLDSVEEHMRLRRNGQTAAAELWDRERSRPSYGLLLDTLAEAGVFYSAQSNRALRRASIGSTAAILGEAALIGILVLLAERRRKANELRIAEERVRKDAQFRSMIQNSSDVITVVDASGKITFVSPAVRKVLGYDPEQQLGSGFDFVHPDDLQRSQEAFTRFLSDPEAIHVEELRARHADGSWRWIEISAINLLSDSNVQGIVLNYRDVTERKELQNQICHQALHDALTGLTNRALFYNLLEHSITSANRRKIEVAAFFIDLDNFKQINDGLGHEAGDQLLIQVAERLRSTVRAEDVPARLGGDEFAILTQGLDRNAAAELAKRILENLQLPYELAGHHVSVGASIGIAFAGPEGISPEDLLRNADVAMYVAKGSGKGRFEIFEGGMYREVKEQLDLELDFRSALENQQFELYYQPIVELGTGNLVGVEALVRWRDEARRRLLLPAEFLPLAERTGLILPLGKWILETACRQACEWRARFPQAEKMLLSVNLSKRQFLDPGLIGMVRKALAASGLSGQHLVIDVAEDVLLQNMDVADARLRELKALGIRLAIDDFGGGYTALRQLRRLPVDVVKIHKSFVDGLTTSPADTELTHSLIDLARRLKLQTLAEGIELDRQAVALERMGCELGQGFHLARPIDASGFEQILTDLNGGDWRNRAESNVRYLAGGIAS
ncbi:MAG TPA: EAL domain-containing protein [Thermoanaerobaculia bacterium]|nr:EAL domain-containing protein [Thermoanaerobaculia bacterium]